MLPAELIARVYGLFHSAGEWPRVRELQAMAGVDVDVRELAAELGPSLVRCQEVEDGRCVLTLTALAALPAASGDLGMLAEAMRFIGEHYAKHGAEEITHAMLTEALQVTSVPLVRLGLLLRNMDGPWSAHGGGPDDTTFYLTPSQDAFFFKEVHSFHDVERVMAERRAKRMRIAELIGSRRQRSKYAPAAEVPSQKVQRQVSELRTRFATAQTEEQFQAVGLLCREVLISLAEVVHDPDQHPAPDGVRPSPTDAKRRLEAFLEVALAGNANEEARRHARAAVALAHALQHKRTADFRTTALCVEATISVVNLAAMAADGPK